MAKVFLISLFVILLLAPGLIWWYAWRPLPSLEGTAEIQGLRGPAVVSFDGRAVAYIQAGSETDAYAAQGYVTARERMFQMDMLRLAAEGRLSSVFGISALPGDRLMRTLGFERTATEELKHLSEPSRAALEAYCRGVNSYLNAHGDRLPLEYALLGVKPEPWRPVDSLALSRYLAYELDESWKLDELRWRAVSKAGDGLAAQLFKDDLSVSLWSTPAPAATPPRDLVPRALMDELQKLPSIAFFRQASLTRGSTAFVLSPLISQSRSAMLAADKHGSFSLPCDWFLCSVKAPGLHLAGATIPGIPGLMIGRNDDISWSSSLLRADVQDLFVEHFDAEHDRRYLFGKDKLEAAVIREVIPVRFGQSVEHTITTTKHGPVLLRDKSSGVALSWTGFNSKTSMIDAIYRLNHARNREEFRQSLRGWGMCPQLFVYADRSGTIGAQAAGLIPVRAAGAQGTTMSEGWSGKGEWTGFVPFDDLPAQFTGPGQSSGDVCIAAGQKLAAKALIGHQWAAPYRANRIFLALPKQKNSQRFSLADCGLLQADEFHMLSRLVVEQLQGATDRTRAIDEQQQQALALMNRWDGHLKGGSQAASVFESFLVTMIRRLVEPKLGKELTDEFLVRWPLSSTFVEQYLREHPLEWLPPDERTFDTFLITTFAKANTRLKLFFHSEDVSHWQWQRIHQISFKHALSSQFAWLSRLLDRSGIGSGGDADTVSAVDVDKTALSGAFRSKSGPVLRLLIDMGDSEKFYATIVPGQSGHLFSPFRDDQITSWSKGDALPLAFSDARIEQQARRKLYLSGGGR